MERQVKILPQLNQKPELQRRKTKVKKTLPCQPLSRVEEEKGLSTCGYNLSPGLLIILHSVSGHYSRNTFFT